MTYRRRLVAIMFTDIQGYTRLMQQSEEQAVQTRARHREIFEPTTIKNHGEIIQYYGDGTLSIFNSCVDAVRCACQMQLEFQRDSPIPVRIGIHLGDILMDQDDIIGDSVNLASRVESLGVPGSVLISKKVYEEIKNHRDLPVKSMGEFHFKNDALPRTVYALTVPGLVVPERNQLRGKLKQDADKNSFRRSLPFILSSFLILVLAIVGMQALLASSIKVDRLAVLPFENRIKGGEQDYMVEGIHEELIAKLSLAGIKVLPYTTMKNFTVKGKSVKEMARELEVDALVEGSISKIGEELKIRIQLINGQEEEYLMDPFESQAALSDIMVLYGDVVRSVASVIKLALSPEMEAQLNEIKLVDPKAYDYYLRGRYQLNRGTSEGIVKAIEYFEKILDIDPSFGKAYRGLVESNLLLGFGNISSQEAHDKFRLLVQNAIEFDEEFARDHHQLAMIKIFSEWDWEGAAKELQLAIKDEPDSWEAYDSYCQLMWAMGRTKESVKAGKKAVAKDPDAHYARCNLAYAYYFDGQEEAAKKQLNLLFPKFPDCAWHTGLSFLLRLNELAEKANKFQKFIFDLEKRSKKFPEDDAFIRSMIGYVYAMQGNRQKAMQIATELENSDKLGTAKIHVALGDKDKAMEMLERAYLQRDFILMYVIKVAPFYDPIRDDPRFIDLLDRMGLSDTHL